MAKNEESSTSSLSDLTTSSPSKTIKKEEENDFVDQVSDRICTSQNISTESLGKIHDDSIPPFFPDMSIEQKDLLLEKEIRFKKKKLLYL